jgi:nicotinamide riboside kinase
MNSLYCNVVAGPGLGKSVFASGLFTLLKVAGVDCEMVREYAKELVWEDKLDMFVDNRYITDEQKRRQDVVRGKVQVIITDSPLILGLAYPSPISETEWTPWANNIAKEFKEQNNINILLKRKEDHPYHVKGRAQTESESIQKHNEIHQMLLDNDIPFVEVEVNGLSSIFQVYNIVMEALGNNAQANQYRHELSALHDVLQERTRQLKKWGTQNHDAFKWSAILGKEYGKVCKSIVDLNINEDDVEAWKNYRKESSHAGAVALAMIECLDRNVDNV